MSRAKAKRRKQQQRAAQQNYGGMPSFDAAMKVLVSQYTAKMNQPGQGVLFSPGIPLNPQPGVTPEHTPRQFSFPLAINTSGVDRTLGKPDIPSFQQLRMLAETYDGIMLPERVWLDLIPGLTLKIGLTADMKAQGYDDKDFQDDIDTYRRFFEKPDKTLDYHSWLRKGIRDQAQIDDTYVHKRRTRGGALYALEWVDGASMKPLMDDWGRTPEPPDFAYQQYPWGLPGDWFTSDELIHYQETPRSNSPFGFSRVERFILRVNQALRKERRDLALFTEGNIPAGIMEVPEASNWTPDEIDKYEKLWNSLIAGNEQQQVRVKFTQPGMKYTKTDTGEIMTDFDYFLYKVAFGMYGVPLTYAGFVEDVHKSSDEGQKNVLFNRTIGPIVKMYAKLYFTDIIHEEFHDPRFEASFTGYEEEEDTQVKASTFATMAGIGAIAPSDVAHQMGYPDVPKTGPCILTKNGPLFLKDYEEGSDLRVAQKQAQMAGTQGATANSQPDQEDEEDDESAQSEEEGKTGAGQGPKTPKSDSGSKTPQATGKGKARASTEGASLKRSADSDSQSRTGMILAFMLDPATASQIALPSGEDPADLHITLAFLGDRLDMPPPGKLDPASTISNISAILRGFAQAAAPLSGNIGGLGRFAPSASSDAMSPVIALVNAPGLQDFRRRLVEVVESAGYQIAKNFDYTPHCTLAYIPADAPLPVDSIESAPLTLSELCLAIGDDRYFFPIGQESQSNMQQWEGGYASQPRGSDQETKAEYRRWRSRALEDVKLGRIPRHFSSQFIPLELHQQMDQVLLRCKTPDEVRAVFKAVQEGDASFFERATSSGDTRWQEFHEATGLPYIDERHIHPEHLRQRLYLYDAWLYDKGSYETYEEQETHQESDEAHDVAQGPHQGQGNESLLETYEQRNRSSDDRSSAIEEVITTRITRKQETEATGSADQSVDGVPHWQDADPEIQEKLADLRKRGVAYLTWEADSNANICDNCMANRGKRVQVGERFPSGAVYVPEHDHCGCQCREEMEEKPDAQI